jgi:Adaptin N terminal region
VAVERDAKKRRDVIKKVIAYMTLGVDVSRLFTEMLMAIETRDLVVKKMVYLYLCTYARAAPDLAILCVNTLQRDCGNEDPMVRGLALRSLCSLRLPTIVEYIRCAAAAAAASATAASLRASPLSSVRLSWYLPLSWTMSRQQQSNSRVQPHLTPALPSAPIPT